MRDMPINRQVFVPSWHYAISAPLIRPSATGFDRSSFACQHCRSAVCELGDPDAEKRNDIEHLPVLVMYKIKSNYSFKVNEDECGDR